MSERLSSAAMRALSALTVFAVLWRTLGLVWLQDSPLLSEDPPSAEIGLLLAKSLMGLGFIALGLLAFVRARTGASGLFALSAICAGIYFGGPLPASVELLQDAIWLFYYTVGAMLASAALLHFTLIYPEPVAAIQRRLASALLYLPVAVAAHLMVLILILPFTSPLRGDLRAVFFTLETWQVTVYTIASLVLVTAKTIRAGSQERRAYGLDVMALGMCACLLPWALARGLERALSSLQLFGGLGAEPLTLLFIFVPMGFCSALLHSSDRELRIPDPGP